MRTIRIRDLSLAAVVVLAAACAGKQAHTASSPPPQPVVENTHALDVTLTGDALFPFGKWRLQDMSTEGRAQLDTFAQSLQGKRYGLVRVIGHSDRIGDARGNLALSEKRARTVLDYLVQAGVPAEKIISSGRGSTQPVVDCNDTKRSDLVACLAPNRRVEILVEP